ncbi:MAG: glycosyltransferase [Candidatus Nanopelagicales bacterium]
MGTPRNEHTASISELNARLFEKERIEQYLRAEVSELWGHINRYEKDPFLRIYLKLTSKFSTMAQRAFSSWPNRTLTTTKDASNSPVSLETPCDVLLVLPTDKIEIGGLVSATKLMKELLLDGFSTRSVSLSHDPSGNEENEIIFVQKIEEAGDSKLIIACGAETVHFVQGYANKKLTKSVLLMQGPDPYFTPKFDDSITFLQNISKFDLVIAFSPYLQELATFWGAQNVVTAILGPDSEIFKLNDSVIRQHQIVVPCRYGNEKGLKVLLPTLPYLQKLGWKIVGFGDLPELSMARFFDDFVGRLSETETSKLFQCSKLIIDPSWIEGLGLTTIEAAKCGCIPIIQKRGGFEGLFEQRNLPFIEISNFLNPQIVLDAVEQSQNQLTPKRVSDRVSTINWMNGADIAKKEIIKLTNK